MLKMEKRWFVQKIYVLCVVHNNNINIKVKMIFFLNN
jgi:hypothetical protein